MGKSEIFSEIRTLSKTIKELTSNIKIEELFKVVEKDKDGNPIADDIKITYGVQVRLSKDTADDFFPFSYCYPDYDSAKAANKILPGKMIPDLLNELSIKEIQFTTVYNKNKDVIENFSIDSTNSSLNTTFSGKSPPPYAAIFDICSGREFTSFVKLIISCLSPFESIGSR